MGRDVTIKDTTLSLINPPEKWGPRFSNAYSYTWRTGEATEVAEGSQGVAGGGRGWSEVDGGGQG